MTGWADDLLNVLGDHEHRFAIHHPNLSVNNIYVDEDLNITYIIDWAFCSAVPLSILLTAPGLPQSRHEVDASLFPTFEHGFRHALEENTRRQGVGTATALCCMLNRSRPMWLLSRVLSFDSTTDYHLFKALWDLTGSYDQDMAEFFRSKQSSKNYKSLHSELKEDDQTTEQVARLEGEYFRDDVCRLAFSRKVTLVSHWSLRYRESRVRGIGSNSNVFVTDRKLWAWIGHYLKP